MFQFFLQVNHDRTTHNYFARPKWNGKKSTMPDRRVQYSDV